MCYRVAYRHGVYNLVSPSGQLVAAAVEEAARQHQRVNTGGGLANGSGGGGGTTKACLCSPTNHPGSFRCRKHHGQYQWVSRLGSKLSYSICTRNSKKIYMVMRDEQHSV
ncbi:hypothetical protein ACJIZ3_025494 [Penstemon smallii]|uniref:Uncharacterized protein n=1 Tax=Penstemon smallii TaxID=265156 RepID=A0ABD3TY35_9LAMI